MVNSSGLGVPLEDGVSGVKLRPLALTIELPVQAIQKTKEAARLTGWLFSGRPLIAADAPPSPRLHTRGVFIEAFGGCGGVGK